MINKEKIENIVNEEIELPVFLIEVQVSKANHIQVFIDSLDSLSIGMCSRLSKKIESLLDRDSEDFQLDISSPGLDKPFKVKYQYQKYVDRKIDLWLEDETIVGALLTQLSDESISISYTEKKKVIEKEIRFDQIDKAKPSISFK